MPAWMTPELWLVWWAPSAVSRSSTTTRRPRPASSRPTASPTMPPPTTATSAIEQVERGADHQLRIDLEVLVELPDVARLAELLHAQAGDPARERAEEGERV